MKVITKKKQDYIARLLTANLIIMKSILCKKKIDFESYTKHLENTVNVISKVCDIDCLIKSKNTLENWSDEE